MSSTLPDCVPPRASGFSTCEEIRIARSAGWPRSVGFLRYYARLIRYAATAEPTVLHILWHNKIEAFDRTVLMLYYRLLGKRLVFTAHNVNAGRRDSKIRS